MAQRSKFLPEQELHLVYEVEKRPILWDATCDTYKRADLKPNIWEDVARIIGPQFSGSEVAQKFKNLKDTFVRNLRKVEESYRSGAGTEDVYKPKMPLYKQMTFLQKVTKQSASTSNIPPTEMDSISISDPEQSSVDKSCISSLLQTEIALSSHTNFDESYQTYMVVPSDDSLSNSQSASTSVSTSSLFVQSGPSSPSFEPPRPASAPIVATRRSAEEDQMYSKKGVKRSNASLIEEAVKVMKDISKPIGPPPEIGLPDREEVFGSFVATRLRGLDAERKKECENAVMSVLLQF